MTKWFVINVKNVSKGENYYKLSCNSKKEGVNINISAKVWQLEMLFDFNKK
jgi:hypothetical protein